MANLSSLSTVTTAATALSNLILVSPQATIGYQPSSTPQGGQQLPAILFHYEGEQTATLESDITDHFIEDNTAIQDQIALRPEIITTHGFIGELNDVAPPGLATLQKIADKLTVIDAYTPVLSTTALLAYNEAFQLYQVGANAVNSAVAAWSSVTGTGGESVIGATGIKTQPNQTKQQVYFQQFYGYWRSRTAFTIQTPWAVFENMYIQRLRAIQDDTTRMITDFEVTFKMVRTAETTTTTTTAVDFQGRAQAQAAGLVDQGTSTPIPSIGLNAGLAQMGVA